MTRELDSECTEGTISPENPDVTMEAPTVATEIVARFSITAKT